LYPHPLPIRDDSTDAGESVTPEDLRADVPALEAARYFNTGASGPSPARVQDAATDFLERFETADHAAGAVYETAFGLYDEVRADVADFVGCASDEVALTQSTSDGINRFTCALEWSPGDVVVRTDLEHPAGVLPWRRLEGRGVEVRVVETDRGRVDRDAYADAVDGADLVCFSALSWNYGTRLPVGELTAAAHDAGARVLVDAVQVPGQGPTDFAAWGADAVAAATHKWVLGTWGGGFLYVDREVADSLEPRVVGYRSVADPGGSEFEWKPGAPRFEVGTTSPVPYVAAREAMATLDDVGLRTVERRIEELTDRLKAGVPADRLLSPRAFESGLVTVDVDDPEATVAALADRDVVVRSLPDPHAVRASVHAFNDESDVDALLAGLAAADGVGW
jgi:selenocysteine lyase/cysteine desulfurase